MQSKIGNIRDLVFALSMVCGILVPVAEVLAQAYPSKAVRVLVPFPPGGGSDTVARIVAQKFSELLGQQVLVDNRAGASGNIAGDMAAKAAPDGYTLLFGNSSLAISPAVFSKMTFSPSRDLVAISMASQYPFVLVAHPSLPVRTVKDLVALAKAKPNALDYASSGNGTMAHMAMELLRLKTGVRITHLPYKGAAPQSVAVLTGEAQVAFIVLPVAVRHFKDGKLRGLGVAGPKRAAVAPDVPTMIEAGVAGHTAVQWNGLFAPAKTPQAVLDKLNQAWVSAIKSPEVSKRIIASGAEPSGNSATEFAAFVKEETEKWAGVAKASGTRLD
jgi:tripartite-type tricarboxylate transporter receptor subunit TctC